MFGYLPWLCRMLFHRQTSLQRNRHRSISDCFCLATDSREVFSHLDSSILTEMRRKEEILGRQQNEERTMNFFFESFGSRIHCNDVTASRWRSCRSSTRAINESCSRKSQTRISPKNEYPSAFPFSMKRDEQLYRPAATMPGLSGWAAMAVTQVLVSIVTSGLLGLILYRSIFQEQTAPLCIHKPSCAVLP